MLGNLTSGLEGHVTRWIYRVWGCPDIHSRQKWRAIWPHLSRLSSPISVLDAGCGSGRWSLEIAARRPAWQVHGVDRDDRAIQKAQSDAASLELNNVRFTTADFLTFKPGERFDVILSVASAHYLAEAGQGAELFDRFKGWLNPGGLLILFGPRRHQEVPQLRSLRMLPAHEVFSRTDLERMCEAAQLKCESIDPLIGRWGVVAKQIASQSSSRLSRAGAYPIEILLDWFDQIDGRATDASAAWLVLARQPLKNAQD